MEDRKSTRLNSSHTEIYTLSLHDALPISQPEHFAVGLISVHSPAAFTTSTFSPFASLPMSLKFVPAPQRILTASVLAAPLARCFELTKHLAVAGKWKIGRAHV